MAVRHLRQAVRSSPVLYGFALSLLLVGCGGDPTSSQADLGPRRDACLQDVTIDSLDQAIERCDAVIAAHPRHPQPRHERALLLSLAGRSEAACRDSLTAARLLAQQPQRPAADPTLVEGIALRQRSCLAWQRSEARRLTTPPTGDAPSGAGPAAQGR